MNWEVRVPKRVKKAVKQSPYKDRARIIQALREFVIDPWAGDIAKLAIEKICGEDESAVTAFFIQYKPTRRSSRLKKLSGEQVARIESAFASVRQQSPREA